MKAKELAEKYERFLTKQEPVYNGQPDDADIDADDALIGVCFLLMKDAKHLLETRNARSGLAIYSIFKEMEQKFQAMRRLLPDYNIDANGFIAYVSIDFPAAASALTNPNFVKENSR